MADAGRHIRVREVGDIKVVTFKDLERKVNDSQSVQEIGRELYSLAGSGRSPKVVLDFEHAAFMPWAHFEARLLGLRKRILEAGGHLMMAELHPLTKDVLRVNRLDVIFHIHESVEEALRAFSGASPTASTGDDEVRPQVDEGDASEEGETSAPASEDRTPCPSAAFDPPACTRIGDVIIVRTRGRVLGSWDGPDAPTPETLAVRERLLGFIAETGCDIVLDMTSLHSMRNFIDTLSQARRAMTSQGRRLVLCLDPDLRRVFEEAKLDRVFPCFTDSDRAMAWLAALHRPDRPKSQDACPTP
jgi:anti-anti-sigma regulatory factor